AFEWGRRAAHEGAGQLLERHSPVAAAGKVLALPSTLDQIIGQHEAWLTDYQSAAYARRYRDKVMIIKEKESSLGRSAHGKTEAERLPLTMAVAQNLAKLMAYKDEYEVARLYSDPAFLDGLRTTFEG